MINDRIKAFIVICIIITCFLFPTQILLGIDSGINGGKDLIFGKTAEEIQISNITEILKAHPQIISNIQTHPEVIAALAENNYTGIIEKVPVYITVTPTPDGNTYFAGEYQNGTRLLDHPFSIYRGTDGLFSVDNLHTGNSLKITTNVYDYARFNSLHYKDLDISDSYINNASINPAVTEVFPPQNGTDFLVVFVLITTDENISNNITLLSLPQLNEFAVNAGGLMYFPDVGILPQSADIVELETTKTYDGSEYIGEFGQYKQYVGIQTTNNKDYNSTSGEFDTNDAIDTGSGGYGSLPDYVIPEGKSNIENGYLIFEVPHDIPDNQIIVSFAYMDNHVGWKLENQNSPDFSNPYL